MATLLAAGRVSGAQVPGEPVVMASGAGRTGARMVTRGEAVAAAVARGPRLAVARADSLAAGAWLAQARQWENPVFSGTYSRSTPQEHFGLDIPIDAPWLRGVRIGSAQAGLGAAVRRFAFEREAIAYGADTAYTRALAAAAKATLSRRTSRDADSLLVLATLRRDAGDGSDLDAQLAAVTAGQLANAAAMDSLDAVTALLGVQAAMGQPADAVTIALADSLTLPAADATQALAGTPLLLAAADEEARAAELALTLERRKVFASPSVSVGYETGDPGGTGLQTLPTFGIALPLPLFNRNGAAILVARAQRDRAQALAALARIEVLAAAASARRTLLVARERAVRSGRLVQGANRVATLSLLAYREGAAALPSVLEAQRTARLALAAYYDDVAAARNATGLVTLLTLSTTDDGRLAGAASSARAGAIP